VLAAINRHLFDIKVPHFTTIRSWIYKIGLYELKKPLEKAEDWIWIADETIEMGALRCLAIIGVRFCQKGDDLTLEHKDMQLLNLYTGCGLTAKMIEDQFREAEKRTGKPLQILIDGGANLKKAAKDYSLSSGSIIIQDINHKVALLLEKELNKHEMWHKFLENMTSTKRALKQTKLCGLMPPTLRAKQRYMGADLLIDWADRIEKIVEENIEDIDLQKHLGWVKEFSLSLAKWRQMIAALRIVKEKVRVQGYSQNNYQEIKIAFEPYKCNFIDKLLSLIEEEVIKGEGRRMMGSTEVIESIFGKYKEINQVKGQGITINILGMGTFIGKKSKELIEQAITSCSAKKVWKWGKDQVKATIASVKRKFYVKKWNKNCENFPLTIVA
jgi:hypothetical protein